MMTLEESNRLRWCVYEDALRFFAPYLTARGLYEAIDQCRPPVVDEHGARGLWAGLPEDLDARRQELLYRLVELREEATGEPHPFPDDVPPVVPDTVEGAL